MAHSLSPAIHNAAYAELGLGWTYERHDVEPGGLHEFVASLDDAWRGLSVTMPHKEDAARLGRPSAAVELSGVANTIVFDGGHITVHNTDITGFGTALRAHGVDGVDSAIIVGNGATAVSALLAVHEAGAAAAAIWCRRPERARHLVELGERIGIRVDVAVLGDGATTATSADLLVCTLPADAAATHADALAHAAPVVFDVSYDPWPTPVAAACQRLAGQGVARVTLLDGLDLLAAQAIDQIELFTGARVGFDFASRAARDAVSARSGL